MKIALAQINCTVGDLAGNAALILDCADRAKTQGASLLVTPELALSGYPPEDLLLRDGFISNGLETLHALAAQIQGITVVVGHADQVGNHRFNAASVLRDGKISATYHKFKLPNHTVFDEVRYFTPGTEPCVFEHEGVKFGINICADIWDQAAATQAKRAGAQVLLALNASPYHIHKQATRHAAIAERIRETGMPMLYTNMVGGQDELVFDGMSFVMNRDGEVVYQLPAFETALGLVDFDTQEFVPGTVVPEASLEQEVYAALTLGVRDYVTKNGFLGVELGLSGGIDSALTLAIAVDALGKDRVHAVMMPSEFTANISLEDAREMARCMGVRYSEITIKPMYDVFLNSLADEFKNLPFDTAEENIQARVRGTLLMALSNKYGTLVLTTGNKSEMAVGYATLYGDMAGGFGALKDIPKTLVYRLAHYRNRLSRVIPPRVISRAPSAELRANQLDQDSLPPYEILDGIMEAYVEHDLCPSEIIALGFKEHDVRRVVTLIDRNEYKRRQAPVGVRVTQRGFGKDRRYPITSKYRPKF
jgi:NAD+ synthase (glutamine-hydrolysing)